VSETRAMTQRDLLLHAESFLGKNIKEIPGGKSHPQIAAWIDRCEKLNPTDLNQDDSRYAWCGVFVGCMCLDLGWEVPEIFQRAMKWVGWGVNVRFRDRQPGDVMVIQTGGNQFHVTIYKEECVTKGFVHCVGGNQSNALTKADYPLDKVVAVRRKQF
jgi:uncharacterized protein (TIGR02594 family)